MTNLKVLSTVAAFALAVPLAIPSAGFAQTRFGQPASVGGVPTGGGGGGGVVYGGGGGGFRGGAVGGGGGYRAAQGAPGTIYGPGGAGGVRFGRPGAITPSGADPRPGYAGGNWNGGYRPRHRPPGGYWPGVAAGVAAGVAIGGSYYDPYYNNSYGYYDDGYYDDGAVAVAPGGDEVAYCRQRYRSYDPASGTFLGYDGQRYPCP